MNAGRASLGLRSRHRTAGSSVALERSAQTSRWAASLRSMPHHVAMVVVVVVGGTYGRLSSSTAATTLADA